MDHLGISRGLLKEIEDAVLIDRRSRLQVLRKIAVPLSASGLAAASIIVFLFTWNEGSLSI
jgi:ABC-type glycerol-3-phosphate transport system permease component